MMDVPTSSMARILIFEVFESIVLGTHLYVLYEGYGFSVASLYCLGFITGAVTAPVTGALVDKFGRKKAALLYCFLEIGINLLEQYPFLPGLIISRMVGGVTTNLLSSVFETWLDTEYRRREFDPDKYEDLMRDSMAVKNMAAIASGYLAHVLSERFGPVGPFEGAVACTAIALVVVAAVWTENYGSAKEERDSKSVRGYIRGAIHTFKSDNRVLRVCIIQGLSLGAVMIFIFLWVPTLKNFAKIAPTGSMGLDGQHEPAYGLIFGVFMAAGVVGSLCSCYVRKAVTVILSPLKENVEADSAVTIEGEGSVRPMAVEFLAAVCYMLSAVLFLVPCLFTESNSSAFTCCIWAFVAFEVLLGVYSPCEGVIRSLYIPSDSRASIMTLPSIIVNVAVSIGVASTNVIS
jgi:MFS family permease